MKEFSQHIPTHHAWSSGDLIGHTCMVFLDDIIIFSATFEEHVDHLRRVLQRLRDANLKAHPDKTTWQRTKLSTLGHLCTTDGVLPDPAKLRAVANLQPPTTVTEVRQLPWPCRLLQAIYTSLCATCGASTSPTAQGHTMDLGRRSASRFRGPSPAFACGAYTYAPRLQQGLHPPDRLE